MYGYITELMSYIKEIKKMIKLNFFKKLKNQIKHKNNKKMKIN